MLASCAAVASNPGLLLCDEPTGALDSSTGSQVIELLLQAVADPAEFHQAFQRFGQLVHRLVALAQHQGVDVLGDHRFAAGLML